MVCVNRHPTQSQKAMTLKGIIALVPLLLFIQVHSLIARDDQVDSLEYLLECCKDSDRTRILLELSEMLAETEPKQAKKYCEEALELAVRFDDREAKAKALEFMGWGCFYSYEFQLAAEYLEKSLAEYTELRDDDKIGRITQNIGLAYLQSSDFFHAREYLEKAAEQFFKNDDQERLAYCYTNLGLVSYLQSDYATAMDYYDKAVEIYIEIDDQSAESQLLNRIGMTYLSLGMNDKALEYLLESIGLLGSEDIKSLATGYNNIGAIYKDLEDHDKALEFYLKALNGYRLTGDSLGMPYALSNIGTIFSARGDDEKALLYYDSALVISQALGADLQSAKTRHNIALLYLENGQVEDAGGYFREFLELSRQTGYKEGVAHAIHGLGQVAWKKNDLSAAEEYFLESISVADSIRYLQVLKSSHLNLAELLQAQHREKEALIHYKKYTQVKDSLFNSERNRVISEMQTKYETRQKQQENELLQAENELKDRKINILNLMVAGILILAVSAISVIILYRRNVLTQKKLAESEAASLAERIDFQNQELANGALALSRNLSFLSKLLTELKALSAHVNDEGTQNLMSIIRNIQHLDSDPAWSEFEIRFEKIHSNFYNNLLKQYPGITTNEMRLCALLKMGMNTKEISTVTFQNIRAIEAARLRLRKKFGMDGPEDLTSFLQQF
jgi:tetratricopeptide (TPR) repeat protein